MYDITIDNEQWWQDGAGFFGLNYLEADNSFDGFLSNNRPLDIRTKEEIEGVIRLCSLTPGSRIIDCPSGYGRHSLALARAGINVTGCDINSEFLALSEEKRAKENLTNLKFVRKSMLEMDFKDEYDALINMFYSFGFFDDAGNERTARNFCNALKPDGKFLMHTHVTVPRFTLGLIKEQEVRTLKSGKQLELFRFLNPANSREEGRWTLVDADGNRTELTHYSVRVYTNEEYEALCASVGFKSVEFYGDWNGKPYVPEDPILIAVATK